MKLGNRSTPLKGHKLGSVSLPKLRWSDDHKDTLKPYLTRSRDRNSWVAVIALVFCIYEFTVTSC